MTVYRREIYRLLTKTPRVIPLLIVGTIPAGAAGILIKTQFKAILENPLLAGCMLILTGVMLLLMRRLPLGESTYESMPPAKAFGIGVFQAFALLPGISRSSPRWRAHSPSRG